MIVNTKFYHVRNLTKSFIDIPWGVEATCALISPKSSTIDSLIRRIAVCNTQFGNDTHFIIAGDTNDLKLDNILNLSHSMRQLVTDFTRLDQ